MEGSKLIIFATFIGLIAFVFTTLPFVAFVIGGIFKDENRNNDKSINEILLNAFGWHLFSVIVLILLFNLLQIVTSNMEADLIKVKCMQGIFWVAENKASVLATASASAGEYQVEGAYSFLKTTYILIQLFYAFIPIFIVFLSAYIGWEVASKKQDANFFNILVSIIGYTILGLFVYTAWIFTADVGMYMPSGSSLFDLKNTYWKSLFGIS
jgi:hypothetical protein